MMTGGIAQSRLPLPRLRLNLNRGGVLGRLGLRAVDTHESVKISAEGGCHMVTGTLEAGSVKDTVILEHFLPF